MHANVLANWGQKNSIAELQNTQLSLQKQQQLWSTPKKAWGQWFGYCGFNSLAKSYWCWCFQKGYESQIWGSFLYFSCLCFRFFVVSDGLSAIMDIVLFIMDPVPDHRQDSRVPWTVLDLGISLKSYSSRPHNSQENLFLNESTHVIKIISGVPILSIFIFWS